MVTDLLLVDIKTGEFSLVTNFPEFCYEAEYVELPASSEGFSSASPFYIGLTQGGKLYGASSSSNNRLLISNANSFTIASGFLIFTTTAHAAQFAPLDALASLLSETDDTKPLPEWESRRIERGSRIVTAVPSMMSLVLQMPRGNLETINPRPLVMNIVRQDIDKYALYS